MDFKTINYLLEDNLVEAVKCLSEDVDPKDKIRKTIKELRNLFSENSYDEEMSYLEDDLLSDKSTKEKLKIINSYKKDFTKDRNNTWEDDQSKTSKQLDTLLKNALGKLSDLETLINVSNINESDKHKRNFVDDINNIISVAANNKEKNDKIIAYVKQNKADIIEQVKKYPYDVVDIDDEEQLTFELVKMCKDVLRTNMNTTLLKTIIQVVGSEKAKSIIVMFPDVFKKMIQSNPKSIYDLVQPEDIIAIKKIFPDIEFPDVGEEDEDK